MHVRARRVPHLTLQCIDVEWALHTARAIEDCPLEEDPRETRRKQGTSFRVGVKLDRRRRDDLSDSDSGEWPE